MKLKRRVLILVAITLAGSLIPGPAQAAEFSAQMVTRMDSQELKGKVYLQGEKSRLEVFTAEGGSINIARPDKQVSWLLYPAQKMAMEMPLEKSDQGKTMVMPKDLGQMTLLGTETVNGYETEKYETVMQDNGKSTKCYLWVAKKLGAPIKMVSVDGKFSQELRNIKEGNVPPEVFEIPPGYQKMSTPQGMPRMK